MLGNHVKMKVARGINSRHIRPKIGRRAVGAAYAHRADRKW